MPVGWSGKMASWLVTTIRIRLVAKARHMTQPALSQHLAALEAEAGAPLFIRRPLRMVPIERGIALYNQVAPAVDRLERTTSELRGGTAETVVRLGGPPGSACCRPISFKGRWQQGG